MELAKQDGSLFRQQACPIPRLLRLCLRLNSSPIVYRFPVIPSKESRDRREQKRAVDARLGDAEMDGGEEGTEELGNVYGEVGGNGPEISIL